MRKGQAIKAKEHILQEIGNRQSQINNYNRQESIDKAKGQRQ